MTEDIINFFCDSLRFPQFYHWWESLKEIERDWIINDLDTVLVQVVESCYEELLKDINGKHQEQLEKEKNKSEDIGFRKGQKQILEKFTEFTDGMNDKYAS